jgi:hypothetical protein
MKKISLCTKVVLMILIYFNVSLAKAQGDGPRNLTWGPKGVTALIPKWMSLNQNISPGNILVKNAEFKIDVFPITLIHNFDIGGLFAQVMLNAVPGSATGDGNFSDIQGLPTNIPTHIETSGFSDGFVGFKLGVINAPALNVMEFAKHKQSFSMFLYTRMWYSGTYDQKKPLNLGTNRITFDIGPVVNMQFSDNPKRSTLLESYAALHLYGTNYSPSIGTSTTPPYFYADVTKQLPSFSWENHFSHNFTDKLWGAATLRYQYGGALEVDGVKQDNNMNILGWGATVGYQVLPILALHTGYGGILAGDNGAHSDMFRVVAVFTYVNMKKVKAQAKQ